jgi:hypothetical protein
MAGQTSKKSAKAATKAASPRGAVAKSSSRKRTKAAAKELVAHD